MKKIVSYWNRIIAGIALFTISLSMNAQLDNFEITVRNVNQTAQDVLEFDVYLLDRDAGQPFELGSIQLGIVFNSLIHSGGTVSASYDNTGSGLNASQQFNSAISIVYPVTGYPNLTLIRLAGRTPPGAGNGSIISTTGNGTLVTHIKLTSTVGFAASSTANLEFCASTVSNPLYATRVSQYQGTVNEALAVTPGTNAIVYENPVLNPPLPVQYNVTGGGSYCSGGTGVEVRLSDSEAGVTYTLILDGLDLTPTFPGTGNAISFGLRTAAGTYTVRGTNAGGSTAMSGSAIITVLPLPVAPVAQAGSGADCSQITANWQASAGATAYFLDVSTSNTFATFVTGFQDRNVGNVLTFNVTGLTAGTNYYYRVRSQNTCGTSGNSGTITYSTSPVVGTPTTPTPSASTICQGTPSTAFTTSATNATGYVWSVTGTGNTIAGTGTTGTVTWSPAFTGVATVSVHATGCGTSPTASTTVTVRPTPTASISGTTSVCQGVSAPNVTFTNPQALPVTVTYNINGSNEANINIGASTSANLTVSTTSSGTFAYNLVSVSYQTAPSCPNNAVTGTATVTVNALPTVNAGTDQTIANGTSTTLAGSVTGTGPFTYSWTPVAQVVSPASLTTNTTVLTATTVFTLTATSTSTTCVNSDQITVNVSGGGLGASATATPSTVCAGSSVVLAANATGGSGTYSYAWTSTPAGFTSSSASPTVSPMVNTIYYVAVNDGFTTVNSQVSVTVNAIPTITGTTPASRCGPGTVTLGATASAGTINWYAAPTGGSSLGTGGSFTTPSLSATTTYYVDATNNGCTTAARTGVTATVNALPTVNAGTDQTIANGTSTTLTGSVTGTGPFTYSWTPAAQVVSPASLTTNTTVLTATTVFTLTATSTSTICVNSDQVTVNVSGSALGSSASATPSTICAGASVQLAANATGGSGTYTYSWTSSPGTFTSTIANPTVTPAVTTVYTVVVGDGFNIVSSNVTVTVNAAPPQPVITPDGPISFCAGEDVVLTAPESTSYLWSNGATTRSITVSATSSFSVQVTNAAGCQSVPSPTVVVTVNPLPSRPTINPAGSVNICTGTSQTLTSSAGVSYLWSNGEFNQSISVNTTGSYTVRVTNSFGCLSPASLATTVTVNPIPATPTITASGTTTLCAGGSVTLSSSLASGYLWSTGVTTRNITVNSAGNYWVRVTDAAGCQSAQSAVTAVTVNPLPSAPTVGTITHPTCTVSTGSVVLGGLPAGSWTVNPGGITGTTSTVTVTNLVAGSHTFTVTNSTGCTSIASAPVVINTQPAVPTVPIVGTVTQPTCAVTTGSVGFSGLPSTGMWTLTRLPGGNTTTGSGTTTTLAAIPSGSYTFTVTNASGCTSAATGPVTINAPLPVPAAPVQTVDCTLGFNQGVVTVTSPTGAGYEFRLDAGGWQSSNIFSNVVNGTHRVTVRNSSGCTTIGPEFSVNCGCTNPPLLTLGATTGSTCGITAVTVSGNTFGGSATTVTITENGGGTVTPASSSASPFSFTYTPTAADAGRTVVITVTTNNPLGSPCAAASATYTLTVNAIPVAPAPGTVTHPTCALPGGSVILNNLPAAGEWTVTRSPGGMTITGSGTSTTITGLAPGTYSFTVTNSLGCTSPASGNVVINTQPDIPGSPVIGALTQPTCALSTGSVELSGLPATGTWTLTRLPGNFTSTGTGATRTVTGISAGTWTFTVANAAGCVSPPSAEFVINTQPVTPPAPSIGTVTHPTCALATGSIVLENLPANGEWILVRYPGGISSIGTGTSATVSSLTAGTYNFTVTNADGCPSPVSANAVINAQPPTPNPPVVGTITHPTLTVGTGSVVLSGLPSSGTWTLTRYPDGFTSQGTGTTRTVSGLEPGTYTFTVTNSVGCTSPPTGDVVINARPGAPVVVINNPPNICSDQTANLTLPAVTAGSDANLTFTYWTDAAATLPLAAPATVPAGTYYIMGTSTAGYSTTRPVVVTADELPVANAGPDQELSYMFGTMLNADIPSIGTGLWELVSGTGEIFNSTAPSTQVNGLTIGDNVFSWTVTNGACYPVTDFLTVKVNNLVIPTLITPNQDGANDYLVIQGIESLGRTELMIFDRRGLKVYENNDYDNLWDGVDYNSNPVPEDTYFYVVRAQNGVSLSGYIVVRR